MISTSSNDLNYELGRCGRTIGPDKRAGSHLRYKVDNKREQLKSGQLL